MDDHPAQSHSRVPGGFAPRLLTLSVVVFVAALAVRLPNALMRPVPLTVDAAYYLAVAENLYEGRGFVCDYSWNYLAGVPTSLPVPSNEYWMPGNSILTAGAFAVAGGASPRAAQVASVFLGALLCAITAWIAGRLFMRLNIALLAGAAAVLNYYLAELSLYPDHFMLNAVLVNLSLLALWQAWRHSAAFALLAGALAGLAYLTRTDGGLLVIAAILLAAGLYQRGKRSHAVKLTVCFIIAFAVVSTPWWVRQTVVFGHPSGANPLRTAFLTDYDDLFRLDQSALNLSDYLDSGQSRALAYKAETLYQSMRVLVKTLMLFSLLAIGALFCRHLRREALPWLVYVMLALLLPALVFPYPTAKGGSWHILPAFVPILLALGAAAAVHLAERTLNRRRSLFILTCLAGPVAIASVSYWWVRLPADAAQAARPLYPVVAAQAVHELGTSPAPALTDSAWGLYHVARIPSAQFPTDGVNAALRVADSIGAEYLIARADAPDRIPAIAEVVAHPRFQPLVRYPAGETRLLVYRILPEAPQPSQSPSDNRRSMSQ